MPAILEDAVKSIMKENPDMKKGAAYAIATKSLQKSGDLKEGTNKATEKGKRRSEMSKQTEQKLALKSTRSSVSAVKKTNVTPLTETDESTKTTPKTRES